MRHSQNERMEVIRIVEASDIGVKRTLKELGIQKSTFYSWYKRYKEGGYDALADKRQDRKYFWNRIPDSERQLIVEEALEHPEMSPRELACYITDTKFRYVSESSVYRILKERGLITSPAYIVMSAADNYKDKPSKVHEQWQKDFTYFKIIGWGWYYLGSIMDDYSRYIITWDLCEHMEEVDVEELVNMALEVTGLCKDKRPRLLTDNGPCYISKDLKEYLKEKGIKHIRGSAYHPQTQGKIERYHRTMKNVIKLENYYFPNELKRKIQEFVNYYNNERYHESLNNLTPADVYFGRDKEILKRRKQIKKQTLTKRRKQYQKLKAEHFAVY